MGLAILTLFTGLLIASVAAWYSIIGLSVLFGASTFAIILMASSLELGKIVSVSWLYRNWKTCPKLLKTYLTSAILILMFITSMGIFGFLSKAYIENNQALVTQEFKIEQIQNKIEPYEKEIARNEKILTRLDTAIDRLIELDYVTKGLTQLELQRKERDRIKKDLQNQYAAVNQYREELINLQQQSQTIEQEFGPLIYIAELIYGDEVKSNLDNTVRIIILTLIFVFDPLAICLIIAANMSYLLLVKPSKRKKYNKKEKYEKYEKFDLLKYLSSTNKPKQNTIKKKKNITNASINTGTDTDINTVALDKNIQPDQINKINTPGITKIVGKKNYWKNKWNQAKQNK